MATQAVNTILQTIGGAERLNTGTAERISGQMRKEALEAQQARIDREQAALDSIAKLRATSDLPPRMSRAIQQEVDGLFEEVKKGNLDVNDINQEVGRISSKHNAYKNLFDNNKAAIEEYIKNPEAYISMDELEDGFYVETTDQMGGLMFDKFYGEGVFNDESDPAELRGAMQSIQKFETVDSESIDKSIESFYEMNKDELNSKLGISNRGQFFEITSEVGLDDDTRQRLYDYLKETNKPQLTKMAARRGGMSVEDLAREVIGKRIPSRQKTKELEDNKVATSLSIAKGKKAIEEEVEVSDVVNMPAQDNKMLQKYYTESYNENVSGAIQSRMELQLEKPYDEFSKDEKKQLEKEITKAQESKKVADLFIGVPNVNVRSVMGDLDNKKVTYGGEEYAVDQIYEFDDGSTTALSLIPITKTRLTVSKKGDEETPSRSYTVSNQEPILVNITDEKSKDLRGQLKKYGIELGLQTASDTDAAARAAELIKKYGGSQ